MSDLDSIVSRAIPLEPWAEGEKIPWDDPAFSERMLAEHLSQVHDAASRRSETIAAQVGWIHTELLHAAPSAVLDLGCGPGLYAGALARLGHRVRGIDFSPASIRHAREEAEREGLEVAYEQGDIRTAVYGDGFDFAMLIYGELNVFTREDVLAILKRARAALRAGGRLLIEPHTFAAIEARRDQGPSWYATESGLFSDRPHIVLEESFWDAERAVGTHRWFVLDAATGSVERHADAMQAYRDEEYAALLEAAGFGEVTARADWPAAPGHEGVLVAYTATAV
jgi:SAM-dependent methyltransferase